jgi:hypothetical protein
MVWQMEDASRLTPDVRNSRRRLLKNKQVRLGEFDPLVEQRRRARLEDRKRNRAVAAARISRAAHAIGRAPRAAMGGVQVGRYLANACSCCRQIPWCRASPELARYGIRTLPNV